MSKHGSCSRKGPQAATTGPDSASTNAQHSTRASGRYDRDLVRYGMEGLVALLIHRMPCADVSAWRTDSERGLAVIIASLTDIQIFSRRPQIDCPSAPAFGSTPESYTSYGDKTLNERITWSTRGREGSGEGL